MHSLLSLFFLPLLAFSAPIQQPPPSNNVNNATLISNAQEAQRLNSQFENIDPSDPCTNGQSACVNTTVATCVNGQWQMSPCQGGFQCLAIPSIIHSGTVLNCTSLAIVQDLIQSLGVTGGVDGHNGDGTPDSASSNATATNAGVTTTTVIVFQTAGSTATTTTTTGTDTTSPTDTASTTVDTTDFPSPTDPATTLTLDPSTTTVDPSSASSMFSSMTSAGGVVVQMTTTSTSDPGAPTPAGDIGGGDPVGSPPTIQLTPVPGTVPGSSPTGS